MSTHLKGQTSYMYRVKFFTLQSSSLENYSILILYFMHIFILSKNWSIKAHSLRDRDRNSETYPKKLGHVIQIQLNNAT